MSKLNCDCESNSEIDTIPYDPCVNIFGKDGRWLFQRLDDTNNAFVNGVNGIEEESSWTALPDATNDTKVTVSPLLEDVTFNEPDVLEDSENLDGAPNAIASGAQLVTAMVRNPTPEQYEALKSLECESTLTFYRIDANGKFGARKIVDSPETHVGLKISPNTFIIRDPSRGGTKTDVPYKLMIQFYLAEGWFGSFDVVKSEDGFDPITEIKPS